MLLSVAVAAAVHARATMRLLRTRHAAQAERFTAETSRLVSSSAAEAQRFTAETAKIKAAATAETARIAEQAAAETARLGAEVEQLTARAARSATERSAAVAACANAAGRMQALATSMLADLREMEHRHSDEDVLGDLLHLDHRTAQAGRLADSIAVLTGARSGRRWAKPIVMESILRGAMGRISGYQRVRLHSTSDVAIAGHAAEGVMHALAELLDNAANFSPPTAEVHVYVEEVPAGVVRHGRGQRPGDGRGRSCGAPNARCPPSRPGPDRPVRHPARPRRRRPPGPQARPDGVVPAVRARRHGRVDDDPAGADHPDPGGRPRHPPRPTRATRHAGRPAGTRRREHRRTRHPQTDAAHRSPATGSTAAPASAAPSPSPATAALPRRTRRPHPRPPPRPDAADRRRRPQLRRPRTADPKDQASALQQLPPGCTAQLPAPGRQHPMTATTDEKLDWLLENLLERTPGTRHALVLSRDGLKLCRTPELTVDQADQLAAISSGIQSLSHGASVEFGDGTGGVRQSMTEFYGGMLFIVEAGDGRPSRGRRRRGRRCRPRRAQHERAGRAARRAPQRAAARPRTAAATGDATADA